MLIDILVFDGVDELDAIGPLEVFRSAASLGADLTTRVVAESGAERVTGSNALTFATDGTFNPGEAHVLVVPGGGWGTRAETGAWAEVQRGSVLPLVAAAARQGRILAGVCTGTLILAHAGVVGSRRAATHAQAQADLSATGATVVAERVVDDGNLITCGGVTSGIDLALWLVEREVSAYIADQVAARLEYARVRPRMA